MATYTYDGLNRRLNKGTSVTRDYYYSGKWQVLEEQVSSPAPGCPERQFVWGLRYDDDLVLRDRVNPQSSSVTCLATNERLYALHDYLNATALINTSAAVQERYGYNAFGGVRFMTATFGSRSSSLYAWETLFGDYRWDSETGLYHVRNRYLHPQLGVWLTRDPIGYQDGPNFYFYVRNRPINLVDPTGLDSISDYYKKCAELLDATDRCNCFCAPVTTGSADSQQCVNNCEKCASLATAIAKGSVCTYANELCLCLCTLANKKLKESCLPTIDCTKSCNKYAPPCCEE